LNNGSDSNLIDEKEREIIFLCCQAMIITSRRCSCLTESSPLQ